MLSISVRPAFGIEIGRGEAFIRVGRWEAYFRSSLARAWSWQREEDGTVEATAGRVMLTVSRVPQPLFA